MSSKRSRPNPESARVELDQARLHVEGAAEIADRDPVGAFAIGYDAIRKALSAHMRHRGYRVGKGKGHHGRTGRYAMAALDDAAVEEHVDASTNCASCGISPSTTRCSSTQATSPTRSPAPRRSSPRSRGISVVETRR